MIARLIRPRGVWERLLARQDRPWSERETEALAARGLNPRRTKAPLRRLLGTSQFEVDLRARAAIAPERVEDPAKMALLTAEQEALKRAAGLLPDSAEKHGHAMKRSLQLPWVMDETRREVLGQLDPKAAKTLMGLVHNLRRPETIMATAPTLTGRVVEGGTLVFGSGGKTYALPVEKKFSREVRKEAELQGRIFVATPKDALELLLRDAGMKAIQFSTQAPANAAELKAKGYRLGRLPRWDENLARGAANAAAKAFREGHGLSDDQLVVECMSSALEVYRKGLRRQNLARNVRPTIERLNAQAEASGLPLDRIGLQNAFQAEIAKGGEGIRGRLEAVFDEASNRARRMHATARAEAEQRAASESLKRAEAQARRAAEAQSHPQAPRQPPKRTEPRPFGLDRKVMDAFRTHGVNEHVLKMMEAAGLGLPLPRNAGAVPGVLADPLTRKIVEAATQAVRSDVEPADLRRQVETWKEYRERKR